MNTSIDHLPQQYQADLARLVDLIRAEVKDVDMIILFGSFARGDWKSESDLPPPEERRSGHPSDYDILVVTDGIRTGNDAVLWERLSRRTLEMGLQTHARIIGYDFRTINERLQEGRYFYVDIIREGVTLFNNGRRTLAKPKHVPEGKRKAIAGKYLQEGITAAEDFYRAFGFLLADGAYKRAAFLLHQATEEAYKTILLVFTNYSPHEHWLETLGDDAAMHAPSVVGVFPMDTEDEERRFMQLNKAYIGARYDPYFTMDPKDLEILAVSVRELIDRTKAACEAELEKMR